MVDHLSRENDHCCSIVYTVHCTLYTLQLCWCLTRNQHDKTNTLNCVVNDDDDDDGNRLYECLCYDNVHIIASHRTTFGNCLSNSSKNDDHVHRLELCGWCK